MTDQTTVRTSSNRAYTRWLAARRVTNEAVLALAGQHTKANKLALQKAQDAERKALMEYSQSRLIKFAHVLRQS